MTIVVCMKITPDTSRLAAAPGTGEPRLDQAPLRISTFDENALEEAVRIKESHGGRVVVVSLAAEAPPRELLFRALAIGADEIRLVLDETAKAADALATALILSRALRRIDGCELVLCGEGSLDDYSRQVGPRLGEALGMPVLTRVRRVEIANGKFIADRDLEDRTETVESEPPLLLTVGQEINQPRLPTVLQIMGASKKPITEWSLHDLGFDPGTRAEALSGIKTIAVSAPQDERRRAVVPGERVEEIARNLARVLFERGLVRIG